MKILLFFLTLFLPQVYATSDLKIRESILQGLHLALTHFTLNRDESTQEQNEFPAVTLETEERDNRRYFHLKDLIQNIQKKQLIHLMRELIFESPASPTPVQWRVIERTRLRYTNPLRKILIAKLDPGKIKPTTVLGLSLALLLMDSEISLMKTQKLQGYSPLFSPIFRLALRMLRYQKALDTELKK